MLLKPGIELLSRALRHSTIAAEGFRFPVRNGMERSSLAINTRQCLIDIDACYKSLK